MQSAFLKLKSNDIVRGGVVAVLAAVFATLAQWFNAPGFDFASFQWDELAKVAIGAFIAYIGKNWISTPDGKVLGSIG
jgi:hypothetical protein